MNDLWGFRPIQDDIFSAFGHKFIDTVTAADVRELILAIEKRAELLEGVLSIFQRRLDNGGIQVTEKLQSKCIIRCLDSEIHQVLTNLVSNSIDAMKPSGCMSVRSRDGNHGAVQGVWLMIADNGSGMPLRSKRRVFEAFYSTKDRKIT